MVALAILSGQLIGIAWILNVVAGIPKPVGCLIGGVVTTAYFAAGGLLASAWVNLVQLVVMALGFAVALPFLIVETGGWSALATRSTSPDFLHFWSGGESGWIYVILLGPAFVVSPGLLQKVYGARDVRSIRIGLGAAALALMVFAAVPVLLGMVAHAYDPGLAFPELALPTVLVSGLPMAVGTIALAAIFSAELSSADAVLFMLSTSLSKDLYRRFLNTQASDEQTLRVARQAAIAGGTAATALALVLPSVISSLTVFYSLLTVTLTVPIIAGLLTRRPGVAEALAAVGVGAGALSVAALWFQSSPGSVVSPVTIGLSMSLVAFGVVWIGRRLRRA